MSRQFIIIIILITTHRVLTCQTVTISWHMCLDYYFASAAVTVDSRHHLLRGVDSAHLQILFWACVDDVVHGLSLATVTGRWLGRTTFVQISMTWALTCPETVNQRACMTREMETWLSDSRVGNNSVVDHTIILDAPAELMYWTDFIYVSQHQLGQYWIIHMNSLSDSLH